MTDLQIEIIRRRIRERLAATGMSANEAGRSAGLGVSYANDILSGKSKRPSAHRLARLAGVLGCSLEWLTGSEDAPEGDATTIRVAKAVRDECRDFTHAVAVARLALALCRS